MPTTSRPPDRRPARTRTAATRTAATRLVVGLVAAAAVGLAAVAAPVAGAASPTGRSGSRPVPAMRAAAVAGTAQVAYAGSLEKLNESVVGPAFTKATGVAYQGRGAGSLGLAQEIRSGEIRPNVFESIGSAPIGLLEPRFTRWYVSLAASPIVVAYNPRSRFAPELRAIAAGRRPLADLFALMGRPGFLLGRTNPATDPQGQAFAEMVDLATSALHLPASTPRRVLGPLTTSSEIFSETALEPRLQAGQLDAASAFLSQAVQLHLPYVALPASVDLGSPALASTYAKARLSIPGVGTVHGVPLVVDATVVGRTDPAAATAFVAFQLAPATRAAYAKAGYKLLRPTLHGDLSAVPAAVRRAVGR